MWAVLVPSVVAAFLLGRETERMAPVVKTGGDYDATHPRHYGRIGGFPVVSPMRSMDVRGGMTANQQAAVEDRRRPFNFDADDIWEPALVGDDEQAFLRKGFSRPMTAMGGLTPAQQLALGRR